MNHNVMQTMYLNKNNSRGTCKNRINKDKQNQGEMETLRTLARISEVNFTNRI